jgi:hypothetical protein
MKRTPFLLVLLWLVAMIGIAWWMRQTTTSLPLAQPNRQPTTLLDRFSRLTSAPVPQPTPTPAPNPTILFLGDLMYDRNIRARTREHGPKWPLLPLEPLMQQHDAVVATLEGPITANPSRSEGSTPGSSNNFIFTFPLETAPALAEQGNFILNIGNNHILNQGVDGVTSTKSQLQQNGLGFFGWTGQEETPEQRVHLASIQGQIFAFVNYNQFVNDGLATALEDVSWAENQPHISATVVVPHWGNEYQPTANQVIRDWATLLVTAGADLIVGSHPHVVQDFAEINGKPVYFSLGNTVFDQYFSKETMSGLAVSATWHTDTKSWTFAEHPLTIDKNGQTRLTESPAE